MKVDGSQHPKPAVTTPAPAPFQRVLQRAEALPSTADAPHAAPAPKAAPPLPLRLSRAPGTTALTSGPALSLARSAFASPENLGRARQAMNHEALRLGSVRTEAQSTNQQRTEHRLSELIFRELTRQLREDPAMGLPSQRAAPPVEPSREASPVEALPTAGAPRLAREPEHLAPPEAPTPEAKVQATVQLIEKLELFIQSQRPALRMSLGWPLSAMVEVERTGPREVALRIQGRHGPLAREDLARIREAMGVRGLKLRSLRAE